MWATNFLIYFGPGGKGAEVAVVDVDIGGNFAAGGSGGGRGEFFGMVGVDGVELESTLSAPFYGLFEELAFAYGPKD